jgi:hypothetical protein
VTIPCVASMVVKKSQDGDRQHSDAKMDGAVNVDEGISNISLLLGLVVESRSRSSPGEELS